jgi:hypothetical protein
VTQRGPVDGPNASRLTPPARASCLRCSGVSMLDKTLSPTSSEKNFSEIELDPQEAQDILDQYFKTAIVLTARIWSKHPRSRLRPTPEVQVSTQTNWRDVGRALRARFLEQAAGSCDCYSCRSRHTKRGQREKYWVHAVVLARLGEPSTLVKHLNSRRALTQFDRRILADLLDCLTRRSILMSVAARSGPNTSSRLRAG